MNLTLVFVLIVLGVSKRFETDYESVRGTPFIDQSLTITYLSKTRTYQEEIQSSSDQMRDSKLKDFEYESRNQAVFLLPPAATPQNFYYFKREATKFIMQIVYEYERQEQIEESTRGIELVMLNAETKARVHEFVFTYMHSVVMDLPAGPYYLTFRNRDSEPKIIKFQMGEEEVETEEEAEDITKMSELSDDLRLSRKEIHDLLAHHSQDLLESSKHIEAHQENQSRQYRNTIIELVAIIIVNVAQLIFLRRLLQDKSIV